MKLTFLTAGPVIIIGVSLGFHAVVLAASGGANDVHKQWGVAIFVLYLAQLAFGATIHYWKPKAWAKGQGRRPYQNYFHAVTGLLIIALAMFQVRAVLRVSFRVTGPGRLLLRAGRQCPFPVCARNPELLLWSSSIPRSTG